MKLSDGVLTYVAVACIAVAVFGANPIAQRLFPTLVSHGPGRRFVYSLIVRVVCVLIMVALITLMIWLSGERL